MASRVLFVLATLALSTVSAQLVVPGYSPYVVPSVYIPSYSAGWVWGSNKDQPEEIRGSVTSPLTNSGLPSPLSEDAPLKPPVMHRFPQGELPQGAAVPPGLNIPIGQGAVLEPLAPSTTPASPIPHARAPQRPSMVGVVGAGAPYPPMPSPKPISMDEFPKMSTTTKKP